MIEIKVIGRGGQGSVTFSQILAIAAFYSKCQSQAMPTFGVERRGAPSFSYTRISKEPIYIRSLIYNPDIVVLLDASLLESIDVTEGLKKNGTIIINSNKSPKGLKIKGNFKIHTVDATSIALKLFKADIVNSAMLGAFSKVTGLISLESLYKGIEERFEGKTKLIDLNKQAVKEVYKKIK
jgi:2-oxoacid:acceptor oxidoreductase gamma subunit (pyruvate/2-ketoisovalerate family)